MLLLFAANPCKIENVPVPVGGIWGHTPIRHCACGLVDAWGQVGQLGVAWPSTGQACP